MENAIPAQDSTFSRQFMALSHRANRDGQPINPVDVGTAWRQAFGEPLIMERTAFGWGTRSVIDGRLFQVELANSEAEATLFYGGSQGTPYAVWTVPLRNLPSTRAPQSVAYEPTPQAAIQKEQPTAPASARADGRTGWREHAQTWFRVVVALMPPELDEFKTEMLADFQNGCRSTEANFWAWCAWQLASGARVAFTAR